MIARCKNQHGWKRHWRWLCLGWWLATVAMGWGTTNTPVRIALLSDTHVDQGTNRALYAARFTQVISAVNTSRVDLVLVAGDLTEHGSPEEMKDFQNRIQSFPVPVWYVPGNHDVGDKRLKESTAGVDSQRVDDYERALGKSWFVREFAGLRILGINSPILGSDLPQEKAMWTFLDEAVASAPATPTLVLLHHPLYAKSADEPGGVYWNVEPEPRQRLLALMRRTRVKAVLSGHLHQSLVNRLDNLLFLTTVPVAFGLPVEKAVEGWTLLIVTEDGVQWETKPI